MTKPASRTKKVLFVTFGASLGGIGGLIAVIGLAILSLFGSNGVRTGHDGRMDYNGNAIVASENSSTWADLMQFNGSDMSDLGSQLRIKIASDKPVTAGTMTSSNLNDWKAAASPALGRLEAVSAIPFSLAPTDADTASDVAPPPAGAWSTKASGTAITVEFTPVDYTNQVFVICNADGSAGVTGAISYSVYTGGVGRSGVVTSIVGFALFIIGLPLFVYGLMLRTPRRGATPGGPGVPGTGTGQASWPSPPPDPSRFPGRAPPPGVPSTPPPTPLYGHNPADGAKPPTGSTP